MLTATRISVNIAQSMEMGENIMSAETVELSVVVPTYKEAENLKPLAERIFQATYSAKIITELIVVDDDSRDGTEEKCRDIACQHDVRLITRKGERGLATAVIVGFRASRGRFLLCMDADLSHPPEVIPDMVRALSDGADFVMGSRYRGGGDIEGWGIYRWINSRVATLLARPLTPVSDPLGGYFALPREVFLRARELSPLGYKIALELLVKTRPQRIKEIPIFFRNRMFGHSKLSIGVQLEYLRHLRFLYRYKYPALTELGQFLMVGGLGVIVDVGIYYTLQIVLGLEHLSARMLSFVCAATHNWVLNRGYTFVHGRQSPPAPQWASYLVVMFVGFVVNVGTYSLLTTQIHVFSQWRLLALLIGIALGTVSNFIAAKRYVFRQRTLPSST